MYIILLLLKILFLKNIIICKVVVKNKENL